MKPVAELVEQDRAHVAAEIVRARGKPLRYCVAGPDPDYGFGMLASEPELPGDGFLGEASADGGRMPDGFTENCQRVVEFALAFDHDFVIWFSTDLRADFTCIAKGWRMKLLLRVGPGKTHEWKHDPPLRDKESVMVALRQFFEACRKVVRQGMA